MAVFNGIVTVLNGVMTAPAPVRCLVGGVVGGAGIRGSRVQRHGSRYPAVQLQLYGQYGHLVSCSVTALE